MTYDIKSKIESAVNILREHYDDKDGFIVGISAGKDSSIVKHLINSNEFKAKFYYVETTIENEVVINYLKTFHPDVEWITAEKSICDLIREKGYLPLKPSRYCCREVKDVGFNKILSMPGIKVLGRRIIDSHGQKVADRSLKQNNTVINPIYDWNNDDAWEYIKQFSVAVCPSYDDYGKSYECTLCPIYYSDTKNLMIDRHPNTINKIKEAAIDAFNGNTMLQNEYQNADSYWDWWVNLYVRPTK